MTTETPQLTGLISQTYLLKTLDLVNWGPFQGHHRAQFDARGTAVIGPTGSGKTTLVDAFMTLICAQPRYNLASTGGHESDRDLMSYVRGVIGAGNEGDSQDHILRRGKTVTAIGANFHNGERGLCVVGLLWLDSTSSALADLKRAWIISSALNVGLDELLDIQQTNGMRGLKQLGREAPGVEVFDKSKAQFLARLRRFFEVGGNAFTLLNRAAGLKQLNSVDELFRELVLEDHSTFQRAAEVAAEFDDLAAIRGELENARQQQQSLQPLAKEYQAYQQCGEKLANIRLLLHITPAWFAGHAYRLWQEEESRLELALGRLQGELDDLSAHIKEKQQLSESLRDSYMQAGGADIEQIEQQLKTHTDSRRHCQRRADDYLRIVSALTLDQSLTGTALAANQAQAKTLREQGQQAKEQRKAAAFEAGAILHQKKSEVLQLEDALQDAASNDSNIPPSFRRFREHLADQLGLNAGELPFVAELIEVKEDQRQWRGAIERAMGGHRLRVMVPAKLMRQALTWVNSRHNELHVRLLEVQPETGRAEFLHDGFTRKLNFRAHPHREELKSLLASIDRHCLAGPEQLRTIPHGMTVEGLMSGKSGHFDKQDQRRLDQDWITGFDNRDRLAQLKAELGQAREALQESEKNQRQTESDYGQLERELGLLEKLEQQHFDDIDVPALDRQINRLQEQLQTIIEPDSDTARARLRWEKAEGQLEQVREQKTEASTQYGIKDHDLKSAQNHREHAFVAMGEGLTDTEHCSADDYFTVPELASLTIEEKQATDKLNDSERQCLKRHSELENRLIRLMASAKKVDTGALVETGTELEDLEEYLERLRVLEEEALPEKLARFKEYLNLSSDQGVTQLLKSMDSEVEKIRYRIEDLNKTMARVDFQPGRYLSLNPQPVVHEMLNTLQKARRHLLHAALQDDDGEQHYKALKLLVDIIRDASERRRTRGAQALLDPRYRLQFSISIIDRTDGSTVEKRTGSQGGSGGEKEIIASYILTASLSYALCPEGASEPLFGSVILDEAFSKSSQVVAGRIISALREFGLHPLLITPNKEIKLLRDHTNSAVLIHNRGGRNAAMTNMSWEQLEEHAEKHRNKN